MKSAQLLYGDVLPDVAPLAGAWIEISGSGNVSGEKTVAPLAGAWIEISVAADIFQRRFWSLPSRERGLKYARI